MSRSFHVTYKALADERAADYADPERKAERLARLRDEHRRKRRVKRQVGRERRASWREHAPTPVDAVRITVTDGGPCVHHAATPRDVREVLRRLPAGVTDGLAEVRLATGRLRMAFDAADRAAASPDPLTGRVGMERLPGVFCAPILGTYWSGAARIDLFAYVHDPAHPRRGVWGILLKLWALATLVHEVGHHHDQTTRVARGRWRANDRAHKEAYAEGREHAWTVSVVLPYLRERYPREVRALEEWVAHHGGLALPLEALVDDPRTGVGSGSARFLAPWNVVLDAVLTEEASGAGLRAQRLAFAREIHYRDLFDEAQHVLDGLLAGDPSDVGARMLRADVLVHQRRFAEARDVAAVLVHEDPACLEVWEILADAHAGLGEWASLLGAAERLLVLLGKDGLGFAIERALVQRARARLRLGDVAGAEEDARRLMQSGRRMAMRAAERLRQEMESVAAGNYSRPSPRRVARSSSNSAMS